MVTVLQIRSLPSSPARSQVPPAPKQADTQSVAGSADAHDKPRHGHKLAKVLAGTGLALSGLTSLAALVPQQPDIPAEYVAGFSGDANLSYDQVATSLLDSMDLAKAGSSYDVVDLQKLALNEQAPEESRLAAQELLADPILMNSVDVAGDHVVNREITAADLATFAEQQPDAGAFTFLDLEHSLQQKVDDVNAFDYFDSQGTVDDKFSRQDLQNVAASDQAPDLFKEIATDFLDNPNVFNGFDVAQSAFSPTLLQQFTSQRLDGVISRDDVQEVHYAPTPEAGSQWTATDNEAIARLADGEAVAPDLFTAFHQTDRGNCVTTGVIKASLDHYGTEVLRSFEPNGNGGYNIVMRDGFKLTVSGQELEAGTTASHYAGNRNDTKSFANLLFTSAAKRAYMEGHEGSQTFGQALLSLNNGEQARAVPHYLGLDGLVKSIKVSEVPGQNGAVVYGGGHAYYVDTVNGKTIGDRWGTPTEYQAKAHVNDGKDITGAYILKDAPAS